MLFRYSKSSVMMNFANLLTDVIKENTNAQMLSLCFLVLHNNAYLVECKA